MLPEVGSTIVPPGLSSPSRSAASIIASPMRSFTEPPGFRYSSFARIVPGTSREIRSSRTIGVDPTRSRTLGYVARHRGAKGTVAPPRTLHGDRYMSVGSCRWRASCAAATRIPAGSSRWWPAVSVPEIVGEAVAGDGLTGVEQHQGGQRAHLRRRQRDPTPVGEHSSGPSTRNSMAAIRPTVKTFRRGPVAAPRLYRASTGGLEPAAMSSSTGHWESGAGGRLGRASRRGLISQPARGHCRRRDRGCGPDARVAGRRATDGVVRVQRPGPSCSSSRPASADFASRRSARPAARPAQPGCRVPAPARARSFP